MATSNRQRSGSGNFGDPAEHARAGHQSHKNDPEGGSRGRQQDDFEEDERGGGTATDSAESESHQGSIETLRSLMHQIQADREFHQRSLNELDQGLREVQSEIEEIVQMTGAGEGEDGDQEDEGQQGNRGGNRSQGNRGGGRGRNGGRESGPQKMMRMLEDNGGEMPYEDLKTKAGVKSPYSALYQLQNSGKIERDGDTIRILKDGEGNGGGNRGGGNKGGNRGGNRGGHGRK